MFLIYIFKKFSNKISKKNPKITELKKYELIIAEPVYLLQ